MASLGKIAALIFLSGPLCVAHSLAVGGSVSYTSLLGDFGRDLSGGVSLSVVCGVDLSPTENLSVLASFAKFKGSENENLCASMRSLSGRFLLFPVEEKPYFLRYSITLMDIRRCVDDRVEYAKYPAIGLASGVSIPVSDCTELLLSIGFSRILEEFRAGNIILFNAEFVHHP